MTPDCQYVEVNWIRLSRLVCSSQARRRCCRCIPNCTMHIRSVFAAERQ